MIDSPIRVSLLLISDLQYDPSVARDKETGRQKPFAFILFEHRESVKYAVFLLNNTALFGQNIKLQHNRETGLGLSTNCKTGWSTLIGQGPTRLCCDCLASMRRKNLFLCHRDTVKEP